eukprot:TRINITY_DN31875_c0_g1_i2.p1 TRINITY_DN31875_c0_g1~~TRINITY_DN31875_c0_g1_i2.p1  ORF type:complete len:347 (+),score=42.63 TRINITY_DN31875_c0_g1_i2:40-1041(+)
MGTVFPGTHPIDTEETDLVWPAPGPTSGGGGPVKAGRSFASGDIVEESYCLLLESPSLDCSWLRRVCAGLAPGSEGLLLPLGWGLLLLSSRSDAVAERGTAGEETAGNVVVEYDTRHPQGTQAAQHRLTFRACRPILVNDTLVVADRTGSTPVFAEAKSAGKLDRLQLKAPPEDEEEFLRSEAPNAIERERMPAARAQESSLHGLGVFAERDIEAGEVVEVAPVLPLRYSEIWRSRLRDYVYMSDYQVDKPEHSIVLLPLGLGALYNHGTMFNVHPERYASQPFLQAWVAHRFIAAGDEMLVSYGNSYWTAPWREDPIDESSEDDSGTCCFFT